MLSNLGRSIEIDTLAMDSVSTSVICLKCPLCICGRDFKVNLVCLPLSQIGVILGMDWLRANHVYINCFSKAILFLESKKEGVSFLSTHQVKRCVKDGAELFVLMVSMNLGERGVRKDVPVVCDFPEVFPEEITDLPPEREVEFSIDLVPGTSPVSMALYRMSPSDRKSVV